MVIPNINPVSLYIYHFSTLLTSHPRSTVVLLDTGTPGTSGEIYSENADGETRTHNLWITSIFDKVSRTFTWLAY